MTNTRIQKALESEKPILSVYFTAGYPELNSTIPLLKMLQEEGVGMVEIGFPFSDPIADGVVIQQSSAKALANGMSLKILFEQLKNLRQSISIPVVLMGYLNPVVQFGIENFCKTAQSVGVDAVILPDAPVDWINGNFGALLKEHNISYVPLITPVTSPERIRKFDELASSFIYAVSSTAVTGGSLNVDPGHNKYLQDLKAMKLKHPVMVGFGIDSAKRFQAVSEYAKGAIVGSAFIKALSLDGEYLETGRRFIQGLLHC